MVSTRVPVPAQQQMVLSRCRFRQSSRMCRRTLYHMLDARQTTLKSRLDQPLPDFYPIRMSPLPILLLFGVLMIGPLHGYVTYEVSIVDRGRRYIVSNEYEPFDLEKMNDRCKQRGGYLVQIDDRDEQDKVAGFTSAVPGKGPYFTGLTDNEREGWFYTYNDKKWANYHRFRWFQPDNWYNEDCVEITDWGLNDLACGTNGKYVCEIPI
ncbi:collectin-12 [Plakobranchus ocellatus]|uniref:Collectin-12 n=1 Tax=Plakobranchus ocellatus TaxID=259542 RepID=A0AAV3ZD90_9GAST|nr:collectin-12 [Plakobranchus ocellatus]